MEVMTYFLKIDVVNGMCEMVCANPSTWLLYMDGRKIPLIWHCGSACDSAA